MARIWVHLYGKMTDLASIELLDTYLKRMKPNSVRIMEHSVDNSQIYLERIERTADGDDLFLLDENGEQYTSEQFSILLKRWKLSSRPIHLAIGPPDGFSSSDYPQISLSRMTFPHELATVFLV